VAVLQVPAVIIKKDAPAGKTVHFSGHQEPTPSEGQENQNCGYLLLPEVVQLRTTSSGNFGRSGLWKTPSGATLATYEQQFFRWQPQKVSVYRGAKLLFKTELDGLDMNHSTLPGHALQRVGILDCERTPLFYFDVRNATTPIGVTRFEYDIYDGEGNLIAVARYNTSEFYPDQMMFRDMQNQPIAVAEAPGVQTEPLKFSVEQSPKPSQELGISPWEVKFYGAESSSSDLVLAQFRWVVVAIVQDHALRVADTPPRSLSRASVSPAELVSGAYKATIVLLLPIVLFIACSAASATLYEVLLPSSKKKDTSIDDPFLLRQGSKSTVGGSISDHPQDTNRSLSTGRNQDLNVTLPPPGYYSAGEYQRP